MSVVSDSYDIYNACSKLWGEELKGKVDERLAKTGPPQGRLVVRPDSGEPKDVVVKCLELLGEKFGTSTTSTGHKMLPKHVRVLQGDGISYGTVGEILAHMAEKGWATDSVMFGSGGALLQCTDALLHHLQGSLEELDMYKSLAVSDGSAVSRQQRLRRLLTHFARTAPPDQGYCQGLNFLGSTLLRVFDANRDPRATTVDARGALAFRGLVALVAPLYAPDFRGLRELVAVAGAGKGAGVVFADDVPLPAQNEQARHLQNLQWFVAFASLQKPAAAGVARA